MTSRSRQMIRFRNEPLGKSNASSLANLSDARTVRMEDDDMPLSKTFRMEDEV